MLKLAIASMILHSALTAFEYTEPSPGSLYPFTGAAIDYAYPEAFSSPAYLPGIDNTYFSQSIGQPYSLEGLQAARTVVGYSNGTGGCQASYTRFGIDEYREQIGGASVGVMPLSFLSAGISAHYYNITINCEDLLWSGSWYDATGAVLFIPHESIRFAFIQENIYTLYKETESPLIPSRGYGGTIFLCQGVSATWNLKESYYGYVNSFSLRANILESFSISLGYSRESETTAAAFSVIYNNIHASYGIKYHTHLGYTHSFSLTMWHESPSLKTISYGKSSTSPKSSVFRRININTCGEEELRDIPSMKEVHADRIIKHREAIGPLSKKSLTQIGMTTEEIRALIPRVYGFTKSDTARKEFKETKPPQKSLTIDSRVVFKKLLKEGLSASEALKLSTLAQKGKRKKVHSIIDSMSSYDPAKRKRLKKICSGG